MQRPKIPYLILASFLFSIIQECSCIPSRSKKFRLGERNNSPSSHSALPPIINTTAVSTNGTSIQPLHIETKLYIPPSPTSNLTNRQMMGERRIITCVSETGTFHHSHCKYKEDKSASIRKWVAWCREPIPSHIPSPTFTLPWGATAMASSLSNEDTSLWPEWGSCEEDEICIDSLYSLHYYQPMRLIANCVKKSLFVDAGAWKPAFDDETEGEYESAGSQPEEGEMRPEGGTSSSGLNVSDDGSGPTDSDLAICKTQKAISGNPSCQHQQPPQPQLHNSPSLFAGKYASVVVSRDENGDTPIEVEELELRSLANSSASGELASGSAIEEPSKTSASGSSNPGNGEYGNKIAGVSGIAEQERKCTNCMKLKTLKPFTMDTEALEMDVKMVGAGSVALAGVLWVALLSGG